MPGHIGLAVEGPNSTATIQGGMNGDSKGIRFYDLMRNHFAYVPTFGSANSATATLYAGRGNDWDQTSLFIALMRAAGYEANNVVGDATYSAERLSNWLGVDDDAGNLLNRTYAGRPLLEYGYDDLNRIVEADGLSLSYDDGGRLAAVTSNVPAP